MTRRTLQFLRQTLRLRRFFVAATCLVLVGASVLAAPSAHAADATYSCGTYSAGAYSNNQNCDGSETSVTPPNTGFAKLTEPANLATLIASLLLLLIGIALIIKARSHKKRSIGFQRRD